MNASIKKLLSVLVVMAMIASMIVPVNFSTAKAEEAPASQTEIAKGNTVKEKSQEVKDIFAAATGDPVTAICPACYANGDTAEKTWTAIAKGTNMTAGNHYYVAADITDSTSTGTYITGGGCCLNLNGKNITLTGGCRFLNVSAGGNTNIMDTAGTSVVKGSYDNDTVTNNYATTLRVFNAGAVVNLFGGTYERIADTETASDNPVPVVGIRTGAMNMYDGATIQNGDSTQSGGNGGNVYVNTGTTFNMYGGTIQGGKAASRGGNIYVLSTATLNVYGGEVLNGTGAYGGNIYVLDAGILNISGGFIAGGVGTSDAYGANVYVRNNQGTLSLTGGTIVGGVSGGSTANTNITMSGAPKVVSSAVHNGVSYTATRGLEKCPVDTTNLTEGADLWIGETMSQSYAYCPACGEIKSWTTFTDATTLEAGNHYRLKDNYNKSFDNDDTNNGFITVSCCFDLNGKELTVNAGRFADAGASETISVFDLAGGAVVKACNDSASQNGSVIRVNGSGAVVNLYGGTYKTMEDVLPEGVQNREVATSLIRVRQGELNMYDGVTVDGEGSFTDGYGGAIHVGHTAAETVGTFNMYGGVLKNGNTVNAAGTSSGYGGNLYVNISGIVNLSGGTIVGGNGRYGGNVYVEGGGALNMTGGTILGGAASESGSNIYVSASKGTAAITLGGGTVVGGIVIAAGTTVKLADDVQVALSGSYDGQSYNETIGLELGGFEADVSELTNEAKIYITGEEGDIFTAAHTGDDLSAVFVPTDSEYKVVKNAEDKYQIVLAFSRPVVGVFDPESCGGKAYCPICGGEEPVEWTAISTPTVMEAGKHYYLAQEVNYDFNTNNSDNAFLSGVGCFNLNGKNITVNAGSFLTAKTEGTVNIMDTAGTAVVTGSNNRYGNNGLAVMVNLDGAVVNLYGGTYKGMQDTITDTAVTDNDNTSAVIRVRLGTLKMYDGVTVDGVNDDTFSLGSYPTVYIGHTSGTQAFYMYGGTIKNGRSTGNGANLQVTGSATATIEGGQILDGTSTTNGGNIGVADSATLNIKGGAILKGTATAAGGNIYVSGTATLKVYDGFVAGGEAKSANNIYLAASTCNLELHGGTIVGAVLHTKNGTSNTAITVSGAPKVVPSAEYNGVTYTETSGLQNCSISTTDLTEGADLWRHSTCSESVTYCPKCDGFVTWTTITDSTTMAAGKHYRLKDNYNKSFDNDDTNNGFITVSCCFDLNGKELTVNAGRFADAGASETISVFDLAGGAVVKACNDSASQNGSVIRVNGSGAVVNLYGGTYKTMEDVLPEGVQNREVATSLIRVRQGELNMYDGVTVDGEGSFTDGYGGTIHVGHTAAETVGTFNMYGGVLKNGNTVNAAGTSSGYGGNLYVNISGIVNLSGGTIVGGNGRYGGNVYVEGGKLNMTGGTILGGTAAESGSNIYVSASKGTAAITLGGGTVVGGIVIAAGTTVKLANDVQVSLRGSYDGQTYNETIGLDLGGFEADVSELTNEARIVVTGTENDGAFTAAFDGAEALKDVFSVTNGYIVKLANNQFALVLPAASIDGTLYETAQEALEVYDIESGKMISLNGEVVIAENIILDAANSSNLVLSGTGTVYGVDTSNDDFDGYQKINVTGDVVVAAEYVAANGNRYMALKEGESTYGFHRFETKLTHVTLRTTAAGLYYKASYQCDTLVRDRVLAYGVVLSTADMPGTDFLSDTANLYTIIEGQFADLYGDEVANTVKTTSGSVFGILKDINDSENGRTAEANTAALSTYIYANSYIMVDTDGTGESAFFMADTTNGGMKRTDEGFDGVAWNLLEVVTAINNKWNAANNGISDGAKDEMIKFASAWVGQFDADGEAKWAAATSNIVAQA